MKPPHTRLTCRAHNRFSPSLVLWQHFIGTDRPFLPHHQPFSSTVAESTHDGADSANAVPIAPETGGLVQPEVELKQGKDVQSKTPKLSIRKMTTTKGIWHPKKAEASGAKTVQKLYDDRKASLKEPEKLLATTRKAFAESRDYVGVVVQPMVSPIPCRENSLPWCLPKEEMTISGMDRLGVEIDRFCQFTTPDYHERLARSHLIQQVQDHVREILPRHGLEVFGSERTGLALATSDIDFRLLLPERSADAALAKLPPPPEQRTEGLKSLRALHWGGLSKHKAYMLAKLRHARYPLISLQDRNSGLDVQIVLSNDTSLSREIMKQYMEEYPYLRQVYLVVKTMFDVRGLSDVFRGGFGSYSLFMMVVASIRYSPHPRNDAAGALTSFLKFYRNFPTAQWGVSIEPPGLFDKNENPVLTDTIKSKLAEKKTKPLPPYMLCLRDPADITNDLGRKAIAIKHVQATFKKLCYDLDYAITVNTRPSLLAPLVGSSYMLNKARRDKLRLYGAKLSTQFKASLAAKAKMVRDREREAEENKKPHAESQRLSEERNKKVGEEAERTAVLEHGEVMASILGMPAVRHEEVEKTDLPPFAQTEDLQQSKGAPVTYTTAQDLAVQELQPPPQTIEYFPVEEANSEAEKRSIDSVLADEAQGVQKASS